MGICQDGFVSFNAEIKKAARLMDKRNLTYEESYNLGYMRGFRIGAIEAMQEGIIKCLQEKGKKHGFQFSKSLMQKINRETDIPFLGKLFRCITKEDFSIENFEASYDRLFLTVDEVLAMNAILKDSGE